MSTWVVLVEWALGKGEALGFEAEAVRLVLDELADLDPVALCQPDRYAVQVCVEADGPVGALGHVLARHDDARRLVPCGGEPVRIEILTSEELEAEWENFANAAEGRCVEGGRPGITDDPVVQAEAALGHISHPEDAARIMSRVVRQLGGGVVGAPTSG